MSSFIVDMDPKGECYTCGKEFSINETAETMGVPFGPVGLPVCVPCCLHFCKVKLSPLRFVLIRKRAKKQGNTDMEVIAGINNYLSIISGRD